MTRLGRSAYWSLYRSLRSSQRPHKSSLVSYYKTQETLSSTSPPCGVPTRLFSVSRFLRSSNQYQSRAKSPQEIPSLVEVITKEFQSGNGVPYAAAVLGLAAGALIGQNIFSDHKISHTETKKSLKSSPHTPSVESSSEEQHHAPSSGVRSKLDQSATHTDIVQASEKLPEKTTVAQEEPLSVATGESTESSSVEASDFPAQIEILAADSKPDETQVEPETKTVETEAEGISAEESKPETGHAEDVPLTPESTQPDTKEAPIAAAEGSTASKGDESPASDSIVQEEEKFSSAIDVSGREIKESTSTQSEGHSIVADATRSTDGDKSAQDTTKSAEDDEDDECGFCKFMKGGQCRHHFIDWETCVELNEKSGKSIVEECVESTEKLRVCMEANPEYYGIVMEAEKAMAKKLEEEEEENGQEEKVTTKDKPAEISEPETGKQPEPELVALSVSLLETAGELLDGN